jgi:hypothetical protein
MDGRTLPGYVDESLGRRFEKRDHGFTASAPDLSIRAGFADEWDYELRRTFTPHEAKTALQALKEAHIDLVIHADVQPAPSHSILHVCAGDPKNLAYEEQLGIDY